MYVTESPTPAETFVQYGCSIPETMYKTQRTQWDHCKEFRLRPPPIQVKAFIESDTLQQAEFQEEPATYDPRRQPKYPQRSTPQRDKLHHYASIKFPLTTEFAMRKIEDNSTLIFIVDIKANKHQIKQVVKKLYDMDVTNVNTLIQPDGEKKVYV
ncbi:large ribosomal subunit protein uL23-like [Notamacropus eugenii]|uniref:large ribosomal subunit protein uL23-like n=1 Tax=Notamacropus eugenii TaxID=9315 RepID=UPI003B680DEF